MLSRITQGQADTTTFQIEIERGFFSPPARPPPPWVFLSSVAISTLRHTHGDFFWKLRGKFCCVCGIWRQQDLFKTLRKHFNADFQIKVNKCVWQWWWHKWKSDDIMSECAGFESRQFVLAKQSERNILSSYHHKLL